MRRRVRIAAAVVGSLLFLGADTAVIQGEVCCRNNTAVLPSREMDWADYGGLRQEMVFAASSGEEKNRQEKAGVSGQVATQGTGTEAAGRGKKQSGTGMKNTGTVVEETGTETTLSLKKQSGTGMKNTGTGTETTGTEESEENVTTQEVQKKKSTEKPDIAKAKVKGIKDQTYTGKGIRQNPVIRLSGKTLKEGEDYKISYKNNKKPGKAQLTIKGKGSYRGTITKTFRILPQGTVLDTVTSDSTKFSVTWKKQSSQTDGYRIQISTDSKFRKISRTVTVRDKKTTGKTIKKLTPETVYYVRICTYKLVDGKKFCSLWSTKRKVKLHAAAQVRTPSLKFVDWAAGNKVSIRWTKVDGADGYVLYQSDEEFGKYERVCSNSGSSNVRCILKTDRGKTCCYQVRAYMKKNQKTFKSEASNSVLQVKYKDSALGYLFPDGPPQSQSQMQRYLQTVTLPVCRSNGSRGTIRLQIHKKLVSRVKACFQEMADLGFVVRSSDTGSYNWRKMRTADLMSHHSYGCVVDLNWNANPMVTLSQIGHSAYRPGSNSYSITGKVVEIWKNHGFYWGGDWTEKKDYMHMTFTNN